VKFDGKLAYVQVFASDFDDHLLRNKTAVADVIGGGGETDLNIRWFFGSSTQSRSFLEFSMSFLYLLAEGDQTQAWYGDDPVSEDDDTGKVITGIPHEVESLQGNIGLRLGLRF
jgi:hypothetical protein